MNKLFPSANTRTDSPPTPLRPTRLPQSPIWSVIILICSIALVQAQLEERPSFCLGHHRFYRHGSVTRAQGSGPDPLTPSLAWSSLSLSVHHIHSLSFPTRCQFSPMLSADCFRQNFSTELFLNRIN